MERLKMTFYALLLFCGIIAGIFFVGNLILNLLGLGLYLSLKQAFVAFIGIMGMKYLIHFIFPTQYNDLKVLENEIVYLQSINDGMAIIIASIIKSEGGRVTVPTDIIQNTTADDAIAHSTNFVTGEEIFTIANPEEEDESNFY